MHSTILAKFDNIVSNSLKFNKKFYFYFKCEFNYFFYFILAENNKAIIEKNVFLMFQ